jgi:cytochrome c oxidase subunit IV
METNETTAMKRQVRTHLTVFLVLAFLIGSNVGITFAPLESSLRIGIQVALAALSGGLVITFFMHLQSETAVTYLILAITCVLFAGMMVLTWVAHHDHPTLTEYNHPSQPAGAPAPHHVP